MILGNLEGPGKIDPVIQALLGLRIKIDEIATNANGVGEAGLPEGDEADGATDDGGEAEVEQDHHLLHLLGDQLGQDYAQGGHQTGTQHQTVPFRKRFELLFVKLRLGPTRATF